MGDLLAETTPDDDFVEHANRCIAYLRDVNFDPPLYRWVDHSPT